jgi:hypothetical protein
MRVIAQLLRLAGPLNPGFCIRIENPPWQELVIEDIQQRGPRSFPVISVAHYGEQNGDVMRDPEMLFEAEKCSEGLVLRPYYFRNDFAGVEQYSIHTEEGRISTNSRLQKEHEDFAQLWNANLEQQGFLKAFLRSRVPPQAPQEQTPMPPIQAMNHGDSTMTIVVTEQSQIEWLRRMGLSQKFLAIGEHHLPPEERRKLYPTLSEALEPTLARLLDARRKLSE